MPTDTVVLRVWFEVQQKKCYVMIQLRISSVQCVYCISPKLTVMDTHFMA